ncbi:family 10 glycosylhydrolase [Pelomonas sp. CA6]|uniref:glycoside hydrolase family 10 protein n=1 Tax=Pelomonas sp. CA6 TaxID=2907999 RepID=UPI001F4A2509|nr:family 10 glycosylhydrolase [Pelomonas sp. CA6]MCH7342606.1 family 10 glycosylhydrolase [Pelomonas sp. CA6]
MKMQRRLILAGSGAALLGSSGCAHWFSPSWVEAPELAALAPPAPREFRAAWVATVANIDWPSQPGLPRDTQIAQMHAILDRARDLKLNAIVLQVRTSADALYRSALEPWSEYLSGTQGQDPGYDPLALWVDEAHARGLELHAWFNPYRARQSGARSAPADTHLSRSRPDWVRRYGDQLWIDPGEPEAAEHSLRVFEDVLRRYDIDGLHIDDYFYPYPVNDPASKQEIDFPDGPSWERYQAGGGTLARADWRRQNVDQLVRRLYELVRRVRPDVQLGISPFGLPRPDRRPAGISGFSQYDKLYAHVEHWLAQGWLDYLAPQLYWPREQAAQAFEPLLLAWQQLNPQGRHVWPGLYTSRITDKPDSWIPQEIVEQIAVTRRHGAAGHLHFSMVALQQNRRGIGEALGPAYAGAALPPATPWLQQPPCAPLRARLEGQSLRWTVIQGQAPRRLALWVHRDGAWQFHLHPAQRPFAVDAARDRAVVAAGLNAAGEEGPRLALQPRGGAGL